MNTKWFIYVALFALYAKTRGETMDELNREVIVAVSQMKEFERFLKSDLKYCVLMDIHLALLASIVKTAHDH